MDNKINNEDLISAHYEEYKVLSQEIQQRVDRQEQLSHLSIASSGVLATVYGLALDNPGISSVLLVFPIIYSLIIWLILRHDVMLYTIVSYLFKNLRPKVNRLLGLSGSSSVWLWELYRYNHHLKSGRGFSIFNRFLAFSRYGIPFILSTISIGLYWHIRIINNLGWSGFGIFALIIDILTSLFTFALMAYWVTQPPNLVIPNTTNERNHGTQIR